MTKHLCHDRHCTARELLESLYEGTIFQLPATRTSSSLVRETLHHVETELGGNGREAQFRLSEEEFFARAGRLRKRFYTEPAFHDHVRTLLADFGFAVERTAFDPIRLRIITHQGHENPRAAPIYYAHRDTWYAHSQAEITWWLPLHDVTAEETFVFYPDWFTRPVSNNSELFDHDEWTRQGTSLRIGWQDARHGSTHLYPGHTGELEPGTVVSFAARPGEIVLFAGAHFHQTRKNGTGRTRFSIDFRTVDLDDHATGRGAPNVDNRSRGSAVGDYVQPA